MWAEVGCQPGPRGCGSAGRTPENFQGAGVLLRFSLLIGTQLSCLNAVVFSPVVMATCVLLHLGTISIILSFSHGCPLEWVLA